MNITEFKMETYDLDIKGNGISGNGQITVDDFEILDFDSMVVGISGNGI